MCARTYDKRLRSAPKVAMRKANLPAILYRQTLGWTRKHLPEEAEFRIPPLHPSLERQWPDRHPTSTAQVRLALRAAFRAPISADTGCMLVKIARLSHVACTVYVASVLHAAHCVYDACPMMSHVCCLLHLRCCCIYVACCTCTHPSGHRSAQTQAIWRRG